MRRSSSVAVAASRFALPLLALLAGAAACSNGDNATAGARIVLETRVTAGPEAKSTFKNSQGWSITLSKLVLSTGPLYYFDGATLFSRATRVRRRTLVDRLDDLLGIRSAHAHPGHYVPGDARGEVLASTSVDLRAGDAMLPRGEGVTGVVRSATFSFGSPPTGPLAGELAGHLVVVEGSAVRGTDTRLFRAEVDRDDLLDAKNAPVVEGCPFTEADMTGDGVITVAIQLSLWFDQVEFDSIPASTDGRPVVMPAAAIGRNELVRGMKAGDGYVFTYSR